MEGETLVLNLDCGHKRSIAANVANSPQRYSSSFCSQARAAAWPSVCACGVCRLGVGRAASIASLAASRPMVSRRALPTGCGVSSQVPRFHRSAYYRGTDPRRYGARDRASRFYDAHEQQPHIGVRDPTRASPNFRSTVSRFGKKTVMHPNSIIPQVPHSLAVGDRGTCSVTLLAQ